MEHLVLSFENDLWVLALTLIIEVIALRFLGTQHNEEHNEKYNGWISFNIMACKTERFLLERDFCFQQFCC